MKKADPWGYAENSDDLLIRFNKGLNQLRKENSIDSRILVVTHGTLIETIILEYSSSVIRLEDTFPDNGSITKTRLTNNNFKIIDYNIIPQ